MLSIRSSLLQKSTVYGVKNDLSVKRIRALLLLEFAIIFLRFFLYWFSEKRLYNAVTVE